MNILLLATVISLSSFAYNNDADDPRHTASVKAPVQTFCNPMSVPDMPLGHECWRLKHNDVISTNDWPAWAYRAWHYAEKGVKKARQFRELADPEVLVEGDRWYLYPSCGMMWMSDDCGGTWRHVKLLEHSEYAPTVAKFRGKYYLAYSYSPLYVSDAPTGPFKELGYFSRKSFTGNETPATTGDPALFADGDHLYLFFGCVSPTDSLWGCELDPDNPRRAKEPARRIVSLDPEKRPWMRKPLEGAYVFKRGDTYYMAHAGGSPDGYCFNVWKAKHPLGPYEPQKNNPVFATNPSRGCVTGTGHGSVYRDRHGDWWINYCVWPRNVKFHSFERFIGQDRIEFDENGDMKTASATCEPQWLPSSGRKGPTGWKRLSVRSPFAKATDENLRTFAEFPPNAREMTFEFEGESELKAFRVIWCDLGLDTNRGVLPGPYRYRLDCRHSGEWKSWYDASANDVDLTCDYREAPSARADAVRLTVLGAPNGITPAVTEFTVFGLQ